LTGDWFGRQSQQDSKNGRISTAEVFYGFMQQMQVVQPLGDSDDKTLSGNPVKCKASGHLNFGRMPNNFGEAAVVWQYFAATKDY